MAEDPARGKRAGSTARTAFSPTGSWVAQYKDGSQQVCFFPGDAATGRLARISSARTSDAAGACRDATARRPHALHSAGAVQSAQYGEYDGDEQQNRGNSEDDCGQTAVRQHSQGLLFELRSSFDARIAPGPRRCRG